MLRHPLVISALALSILIVVGAYFGSRSNYSDVEPIVIPEHSTYTQRVPKASPVPKANLERVQTDSEQTPTESTPTPTIEVESESIDDVLAELSDEELAKINQFLDLHLNAGNDTKLDFKERFFLKHGDTPEAREYLELWGRFKREEPVPIEDFVRWSELVNHFFPWEENLQSHEEILEYLAEHDFSGATATYDLSVLDE